MQVLEAQEVHKEISLHSKFQVSANLYQVKMCGQKKIDTQRTTSTEKEG